MSRLPLKSLPGLLLLAASLIGTSELEAQTTPREGPLPEAVAMDVLALANAPRTLRLPARATIPSGTEVRGDVVVLGGSLELGGTIQGRLVVVNGNLELSPGARIDGSVRVLGGRILGEEEAVLPSDVEVYRAPLHYRVRGGRIEGIVEDGAIPSRFLHTDLGFGRIRFTLRADGAYNRSEGLPVLFGPLIETSGRNPLVLEAFGIWRSVSGLNLQTEQLGYSFTLDQAVGGRGTMSVGTRAFSRIRPFEDRGLSDQESALSTFLLSRDYRDHYDAQGWDVYAELRPLYTPLRARLSFREEEHRFTPVQSPWTLGRGDEPWRPQPLVAEGTGRFLEGEIEWDSRNDPDHPSDGWWASVRAVHQMSGNLRTPASPLDLGHEKVRWGSVDLRRYARVSPSSHLQVRLLARGSLGGRALPPQFQSTLGGEGSLPGHPRFAISCGARDERITPSDEGREQEALAGYGCDRVSLAQLEFQQVLPLSWRPLPEGLADADWSGIVQIQPILSVFLNAGEGWARDRSPEPSRMDSPSRADVGIGILTGSVGLYWAYPLNQKDRGTNFFIRLNHRF